MDARRGNHIRDGFTLVEVLMVLGIIGVVAAMALPRWMRSMSRYQADAAARRLAADLAWAQSIAHNTSSSQTVHLNMSGSTYQLVGVADPDHPTQVYTVDLKQSPYHCSIVASSATDANGNIVFDGYGATGASGSIVLQAGDVQKQVTINPAAGSLTTGGTGIATVN